jgi:ribosomal protein L11 methyltransferase
MFELLVRTPEALVEAVSESMIDELGALSVSIEDAQAGSDAEEPIFGEPGLPAARPGWRHSVLTGLFDSEQRATDAATLLLSTRPDAGLQVAGLRELADQDWVKLTQSQFEPTEITPEFWVVPSWHQPPAQARRVLRIDPGMAFGTGTHATTRMCLRWIARHAPERAGHWRRVLDYGCGSGILAIGAAVHGAQTIDAVDIDPQAVDSTVANALANGVRLTAGSPDAAVGEYQLVLANILATPLVLLAPLLSALVAGDGDLVLAGILARQADDIASAYAPWLSLAIADTEDAWVLMTGRKA